MSADQRIFRVVEVDSKVLYTGQFPIAKGPIVFAINTLGSNIDTINTKFTIDSRKLGIPKEHDVDVLLFLLGSPLEEIPAHSQCRDSGLWLAKQSSSIRFQHRSPVSGGALLWLKPMLIEQMKYSVVIISCIKLKGRKMKVSTSLG